MSSNPLEHIAFEDINDEYCYGNYGEFKVIMMKKNGYINATKMCQDIAEQSGSKKEYRKWHENKSVDELINAVSDELHIPQKELFIIPKVENILRGTYVHPLIITHIAMWCSPLFAVKVSLFIEEWRKIDKLNDSKYWKALSEAKPSCNSMQERKIQLELNKKLNGKTEVETSCGYIDILTDTQIVEIKHISDYKHALGQILMYAEEYPLHKKVIYLFGKNDNVDVDMVKKIYAKYNIELVVY
jgi:hypothetical protein